MSEVHPGSSVKLGYREYCLFPNDGMRHEVINGRHYMNPAPNTNHQAVSKRLLVQLYLKVESPKFGEVYNAPIDVQLSEWDIVQPDLIVILPNSRASVTPKKVIGAPDLVIEILSPSTAENDMTLKRSLYEQAGVREYWLVDPDEHTVKQLTLGEHGYAESIHGENITLSVLSEVTLNLKEVW